MPIAEIERQLRQASAATFELNQCRHALAGGAFAPRPKTSLNWGEFYMSNSPMEKCLILYFRFVMAWTFLYAEFQVLQTRAVA